MIAPDSVTRYARHLVLKEIGGPGQQALLGAKVAIVGAGGLGGPAGLYLAAAGVGQITIIDDDLVEMSNLQRQVQFANRDVGEDKAVVMAKALSDLNPDVRVRAEVTRLNSDTADSLLGGHDIILDGVDDFTSRFAINAACLRHGLPLVSGALGRWDGQVATFHTDRDGPCYRCLVPHIPPHAQTCAQVGIVGALAGLIGSMMALETIKLITGAGENLNGKLWLIDGLSLQSRTVSLPRDPACPACAGSRASDGGRNKVHPS